MKTKITSVDPTLNKSALRAANPPPPVPRAFSTLPTHDAIAARAQMIWIERGRPVGCDEEIWLQAERELSFPLPTAGHAEPEIVLDREGRVAGPIEKALDQVAGTPERRSVTSL